MRVHVFAKEGRVCVSMCLQRRDVCEYLLFKYMYCLV